MKLFQFIRDRLENVGAAPVQPFVKFHSTTMYLKRIQTFCVMICGAISSNAFLLFHTVKVEEFALSFYISTTALANLFYFIIAIRNIKSIFKTIDDFSALIQKRRLFLD